MLPITESSAIFPTEGVGVTLPPEEELPPVAPPPLLASVLSATSVTFPALSTFEVVSFATSLLPAGVVTVTACVVSFFTVTSALSDVVSTLLPSAPLVRFSAIGAAAFTSTGVLEVTFAPAAFSFTVTGTAAVVFPSTVTFTGASIVMPERVPSTTSFTFPFDPETIIFATVAPVSTITRASPVALTVITFPFAFSR